MNKAQRSEKQIAADKRIVAIGKKLFNSKEGLELLAHFKTKTLDRPVFSSNVEGSKQATHAYSTKLNSCLIVLFSPSL